MSALSAFERRMWRASLLPDSLLTEDEACEALPCRVEGRSWLVANVAPAGRVVGVAVYRWREVLAAMTRGRPEPASPNAAARPAITAPSPSAYDGEDDGPSGAEWLTVREAVIAFRISERLLRRLLSEGQLDAADVRAGRTWRIHRERFPLALSGRKEDHYGVAHRDEATQPRERHEGDPVAGRGGGEDPDPRPRLPDAPRREAGAQGIRGQARGGRARGAAGYRVWLLKGG